MAFEERLERGEGSWWARKCWEEIKKRGGRKGSEWEEQRKNFYKERGVSVEWMERERTERRSVTREVEERVKEIQLQRERYRNRGQTGGTRISERWGCRDI